MKTQDNWYDIKIRAEVPCVATVRIYAGSEEDAMSEAKRISTSDRVEWKPTGLVDDSYIEVTGPTLTWEST